MNVVFTFAKNGFDEVRAYLNEFMGHELAHIRVFTANDDGTLRPSKKGIAIKTADLPKLAEAVAALIEAAGLTASGGEEPA